jgi:hypothetical protein
MKDEALKLALEVLEDMPGFRADIDNAITAIKQALSAQQEPVYHLRQFGDVTKGELLLVEMGWNDGYDAGLGVRQALDKKAENAKELGLDYESVQEPVAWPCEIEEADFEQDTITLKMLTSEYVVRAGKHWLSTTPPAAQPCPTCEALARTVMMDQTAHDTQRQPLTDEQIDAVCAPLGFAQLSPREVARAIEAAHGIGEKK